MSTERTLGYRCIVCGTRAEAHYENGDRQYGDLPDCVKGCEVPFSVMDAIANHLDDRAMQGEGEDVGPTRDQLCGYTEEMRRVG